MAHLKCTHERRVVVVRDIEKKPVIRHRGDGSKCDARYVAIGTAVFEPAVHGTAITAGTSQDNMFGPLGPSVNTDELGEVATRTVKVQRKVKKTRAQELADYAQKVVNAADRRARKRERSKK